MTNKQLAPKVRAWLKESDVGPEDARRSVGIVSGKAEQTRQRGRWWPLPSFRPRKGSQAARTDTQANPIPPTSGRHPTVIGRTQSMLSPAKAITAGAIVFAIGGALLIAQPFDQQQGSAPGAAALGPPTKVTGPVWGGECPVGATVEVDDDVTTYRDGYCNPHWSLDDPRFDGTVTWATNSDAYRDASGLSVTTLGVSVVNDEGAWRMVPEVLYGTLDPGAPRGLPSQFVMVGEDGYEGYYAVFTFDQTGATSGILEGFIVPGDAPPAPQTPASR